jgi:hypothetical protein
MRWRSRRSVNMRFVNRFYITFNYIFEHLLCSNLYIITTLLYYKKQNPHVLKNHFDNVIFLLILRQDSTTFCYDEMKY